MEIENLNIDFNIGQLVYKALLQNNTKKEAAAALGISKKELNQRMKAGGIYLCPISRQPKFGIPCLIIGDMEEYNEAEHQQKQNEKRKEWYDKKVELLDETYKQAMSVINEIISCDIINENRYTEFGSRIVGELKECFNTYHKTGIKALKKTLPS